MPSKAGMADEAIGTPSSLLLDTHVFLWWRTRDPRLSAQVHAAIARAALVAVSAACAWEAAIKASLGKLRLADSFEEGAIASGFTPLAISFRHAALAGALPSHHRDPFDRMLVAQAMSESLTLVTADRQLEPYDVSIIWAA
jgi:PIN domain nuclease of toxin-antitoxin system